MQLSAWASSGTVLSQCTLKVSTMSGLTSANTDEPNTIARLGLGFYSTSGASGIIPHQDQVYVPMDVDISDRVYVYSQMSAGHLAQVIFYCDDEPRGSPKAYGPRGPYVSQPVGAPPPPITAHPVKSLSGLPPSQLAMSELAKRVIRCDQAAFCCRNNGLKLLQRVNGVLLDAYRVVENIGSNEQVISIGGVLGTAPSTVQTSQGVMSFEELLSRPVSTISAGSKSISATEFEQLLARSVKPVRTLPKGLAITPGAVALVLGTTAAEFFLGVAAKTAALETFSFISGAMNAVNQNPDECVECILKRALPQTHARKKLVKRINQRL